MMKPVTIRESNSPQTAAFDAPSTRAHVAPGEPIERARGPAGASSSPRRLSPSPKVPVKDGLSRVAIEAVEPQVDDGRFPIKRVVGDGVFVEADVFADGHDAVVAELIYRFEGTDEWSHAAMRPFVNDRWTGEFKVDRLGEYEFARSRLGRSLSNLEAHACEADRSRAGCHTSICWLAPISSDEAVGCAEGPDIELLEEFEDRTARETVAEQASARSSKTNCFRD